MKIRLLITLLLSISVMGCAGTGNKSTEQHAADIYSNETLIFIKRNTGFYSGASLVTVSVNNSQKKDLGTKESIALEASVGENKINVGWKGLGDLGAAEKTLVLKEGEKAFFVISVNVNMLSIDLKLYQVDRLDFMND